MLFDKLPTEKQILKANVLYLDIGGSYRYHRGFYRALFTTKNMAKKAKETILVGTLKAKEFLYLGVGVGIGDWSKIGELYFEQINFLKSNKSGKPFNVTIKDLITPKQLLQDKLIKWDKKLFQQQIEWRQQNAT